MLQSTCSAAIGRIVPKRLRILLAQHRAVAERRLRVTNLTRHTLLADSVDLTKNGRQRRRGLLGRQRLAPGEGLWIVPCEAVHTIGMKFSIDLLYLDRDHRVVKTCSEVHPWRLSICLSANSVLELGAGAIRESQTRVGDVLVLQSV